MSTAPAEQPDASDDSALAPQADIPSAEDPSPDPASPSVATVRETVGNGDAVLSELQSDATALDAAKGRVSSATLQDVGITHQLRQRGAPLIAHDGPVRWGAWSRVGDVPILATGGDDGKVHFWDGRDARERSATAAHDGPTLWGKWTGLNGEKALATGGVDGAVRMWDAATGRPRAEISERGPDPALWGAGTRATEGWALAVGFSKGRAWIFSDTQSGSRPLTGGQPTHATSLWGAWNPFSSGRVLAVGRDDGTVSLFDNGTGKHHRISTAHNGPVHWGAWSAIDANPVLATGGQDSIIHIHVGFGPSERNIACKHAGPVRWGAWTRIDGVPTLAAGADGGHVRVWEFPDSAPGRAKPIADFYVGSQHAAPAPEWGTWARVGDLHVLATGGDDGAVRLWNGRTGRHIAEAGDSHAGVVRWGEWAEVSGVPVLATGCDDGSIRLWELVVEHSVRRRPVYRSDDSEGIDRLDRAAEATALADLLLSRSARPPLAVGLFGEWGEGKSYFLRLLREQVSAIANGVDVFTHHQVRQIRFNAWHYAETDLWASLVAEIFSQLAEPASDEKAAEAQREQSRLASEIIAERRLPERIAAERERAQKLRDSLKPVKWKHLSEDRRRELSLAIDNLDSDLVEEAYQAAVAPMAKFRLGLLRIEQVWRAIPALGRSLAVIAATLSVALCGLFIAVPGLPSKIAAIGGSLVSLALGGAAVWATARTHISAAIDKVKNVRSRVDNLMKSWQAQVDTALKVSEDNIRVLESELQNITAAGQLAGFVTNRASEGAYRKSLGLMSQIRQDFETMSKLLTRDDSEHSAGVLEGLSHEDVAGDTVPRIDRIVLYIDDLDRCPPDRVVEVLEAVHLLLAVRLFVVVVAVDPRWLLRAIGLHYRDVLAARPARGIRLKQDEDQLDPDDEEYWASTPAQYLEKIFQVVFALPAMTTSGYTSLLDEVIGPRADIDVAAIAAALFEHVDPSRSDDPEVARNITKDAIRDEAIAQPQAAASDIDADFDETADLPEARFVDRVDPLALDGDELALMRILGPPLITTPRAVKRLANSYGLLATVVRLKEPASSSYADGDGGGRNTLPAMVLLAALIGFPSLGARFLSSLHRCAGESPTMTWNDFVKNLRPIHSDRWSNAATTVLTPHEVDEWQTFTAALDRIIERSHSHGIELPSNISGWSPWISLVGRLSFTGGSVAGKLSRMGNADDAG